MKKTYGLLAIMVALMLVGCNRFRMKTDHSTQMEQIRIPVDTAQKNDIKETTTDDSWEDEPLLEDGVGYGRGDGHLGTISCGDRLGGDRERVGAADTLPLLSVGQELCVAPFRVARCPRGRSTTPATTSTTSSS